MEQRMLFLFSGRKVSRHMKPMTNSCGEKFSSWYDSNFIYPNKVMSKHKFQMRSSLPYQRRCSYVNICWIHVEIKSQLESLFIKKLSAFSSSPICLRNKSLRRKDKFDDIVPGNDSGIYWERSFLEKLPEPLTIPNWLQLLELRQKTMMFAFPTLDDLVLINE